MGHFLYHAHIIGRFRKSGSTTTHMCIRNRITVAKNWRYSSNVYKLSDEKNNSDANKKDIEKRQFCDAQHLEYALSILSAHA